MQRELSRQEIAELDKKANDYAKGFDSENKFIAAVYKAGYITSLSSLPNRQEIEEKDRAIFLLHQKLYNLLDECKEASMPSSANMCIAEADIALEFTKHLVNQLPIKEEVKP